MASIEGPALTITTANIIHQRKLNGTAALVDEIDRIVTQGREENNGYCLATVVRRAISESEHKDEAVSALVASMHSDELFPRTYSYQTLLELANGGESPYAYL